MNYPLPIALNLAANWKAVRDRISQACLRAGRSPDEISVVAVGKTHPLEIVRKARAIGISHFGENRVQETIEKYGDSGFLETNSDITLHMIGHLQRNKVRKALQVFDNVDSVESVDLARILDIEAGNAQRRVRVLLEVNTTEEPQKFGVGPDSVIHLASVVQGCRNLQLSGLMTVGPNVLDPERVRESFRLLKELFDRVAQRLNPPSWSVLSMGMSGDYEIAIEEGSTELRLGTALFGQRREP